MNPEAIESVQALITESQAHFWTAPGTATTCCVLALKTGVTVVGKSICPPDVPLDANLARKLAFDDAVEELMRLELYRQAMKPRAEVATPAQVLKLVK